MAEFDIKIDDTEVRKAFRGLSAAARNFKVPLEESGNRMMKMYSEDNFQQQGAPSGARWKELSAATLQMRKNRRGHYAKPGGGSKILVWTGELRRRMRKRVTRTELKIGNTSPYFEYHQTRGGKTPQRKILFINKNIIADVQRTVLKHFNKSMK